MKPSEQLRRTIDYTTVYNRAVVVEQAIQQKRYVDESHLTHLNGRLAGLIDACLLLLGIEDNGDALTSIDADAAAQLHESIIHDAKEVV